MMRRMLRVPVALPVGEDTVQILADWSREIAEAENREPSASWLRACQSGLLQGAHESTDSSSPDVHLGERATREPKVALKLAFDNDFLTSLYREADQARAGAFFPSDASREAVAGALLEASLWQAHFDRIMTGGDSRTAG
jgi:hypothetical protein